MSTPDLRELADAAEGELTVTAGLMACFSDEQHRFVLSWSPSGAKLSIDPDPAIAMDRAAVSRLVRRIVDAASRPEVSSGAQSTTGYAASLRWSRVAPDGARAHGEISFSSRDMHPDRVREIVKDRPDLQAMVPADAYAPAIALLALAQEITRAGYGQAASRPATVKG
jgi:hypothetical protein